MELNSVSLTTDIFRAPLISVCWVIFEMHPGSEGGVLRCATRDRRMGGGGDLRAAGAGQSWKEVTRTWRGGPRFHRLHSSPQGLTAGLARYYGPVIAHKTVCECVSE